MVNLLPHTRVYRHVEEKINMQLNQILSCIVAAGLLVPTGYGSSPMGAPDGQSRQFDIRLSKDKQIPHALDRLTFGPRPGDAEMVQRIGLKKWIDQQLNPQSIPENPELLEKLRPLESLNMTPEQAAEHFPLPPMIKAIADGRAPMPADPVLRASITRLVAIYKAKKDADGKGKGDQMPAGKPLNEILNPSQVATMRTGTLEQKRDLLRSLPEGQQADLIVSLPRGPRQQMFLAVPVEMRRKIMLLTAPRQALAYDLTQAKLLRAVYSDHQLAEELDDFWYNHFNVFFDKGADRYLTPSYEREAIRPHVLGKFRDLLEATAKSPAMMFYLDNAQSVAPGIDAKMNRKKPQRGLNENYARELMELHTLGVNGGYTQHDVIEVARCFTGWSIRQPRQGGGFFYNDKVHDKGEKVVLGHVIPAGGGIDDGEKVLDILAHHPSTAKFISLELAQRFVADNPPQALVDRMAKTFLQKDGDIREVLKTMINSKEFWSEGSYRAKVKTPFEMVVSAVRALDAKVDDTFALAGQIGQLGEPLYRKLEPTGYSNVNSEWVNSAALLGRMNFALNLAQNKVPGVRVDVAKIGPGNASDIAQRLLLRDVSPQTRATVENALKEKQAQSQAPAPALIAGLVLGSPDFQRK